MAKMKVASSKTSYSTSKTIKEEYKTVAGPKVDYTKYFMDAPKAPKYYTPTVKTDKEILKEAENRYKGLYDTYIKNSERERNVNVDTINRAINALDSVYEERLTLLKDSYKDKEKALKNNAMSKGMGRSSYLIDSQNENNKKMLRDTHYLNNEKQHTTAELEEKVQQEYADFENKRDLYNARREYEIDKLTAEMERDRNKTLFEAQKYNDSLYDNYNKLLLNQKKHNLNVQKYIDSLNTKKITVTTTNKTTKSTTYKSQTGKSQTSKSQTGLDREAVESLWSRMNGGQKIKYVQQNKSLLKAGAADLYGKYATEAGLYGVNTAFNQLKNLFL